MFVCVKIQHLNGANITNRRAAKFIRNLYIMFPYIMFSIKMVHNLTTNPSLYISMEPIRKEHSDTERYSDVKIIYAFVSPSLCPIFSFALSIYYISNHFFSTRILPHS